MNKNTWWFGVNVVFNTIFFGEEDEKTASFAVGSFVNFLFMVPLIHIISIFCDRNDIIISGHNNAIFSCIS